MEVFALYYAVAGSAALIIAVMLAVNGELTAVCGEHPATLIIHLAGLAAVSAAALIRRENPFKKARGVPFALLLGGVINYFTTFFNTLAVGRISVTAILALSLLGQAATSLVIDRLGLFGMEKRRLGALELAGLAVTALGIALLLGGTGGGAPALPVAVSVLSGTACVCTRQVTAQLSERTSLLTGTWFSYFTGSVVAVAALGIAALAGAELRFPGLSAPAWAYLGGVLGAIAVYLQSICVKRMSSVAMTLVMFAGQVFGGAAIDAAFYGEFSGETLTGGALAFAGLVLNALAARKKGA